VKARIEARRLQGVEALELLACANGSAGGDPPLLFVHGAYVGAWCWAEHFLPWFAARGYEALALSLRGHGASDGRERLHGFGISDYVDDLAIAIAALPRAPVVVGHSMGSLVLQKFLERGNSALPGAVHICPVPPFGLLPSTFQLAFLRPGLFAEINALASGHRASRGALAEALFAGPGAPERVDRYYGRMQRESHRALMDMTLWNLPQLWRMPRVEALVLGAEHDALIAPSLARSAAGMLRARYQLLEGLGHAVMLETEWERAAQAIDAWLCERLPNAGPSRGAREKR
jgi:pimeloyl-ACP methyl ester carboxylesterase